MKEFLSPLARQYLEKITKDLDAKQVKIHQPFPEQLAFINDKARFTAAQCGRRAGKTYALAEKFLKQMEKYPGSLSRYIALTRDSAKDIMWPVLHELNDKYNLGANLAESTLTMTLPNGAKLRLFGADMINFIRRLKGAKSPAVAIDEAQEFGNHLETLINDVLTPTIADYADSWISLTGTPGPIPRGYFYDVTHAGKYNYSVHRWTIFDNPHMPGAGKFVEELKARNLWTEETPTYLREYKNRWVLDTESLLIKYKEELNHYETLPQGKWVYILGVDIGHRDADALAVVAWNEQSKEVYLVEEVITRGQDITELSNQITAVQGRYEIAKIIMDEGALGKKIAEEIRRRKHLPIQPADKMRKMENVAFLNEWLRLGHFKAKKDSRFAQESYQLQIDYERTTPTRLEVKKGFHSDIIDAVLYAFKESPAFTYQKEPPKPVVGTTEWFNKEVTDMEKAAQDHFEALEEASKGFSDDWP